MEEELKYDLTIVYAGFWKRAAAYLIDHIILLIISPIWFIPIFIIFSPSSLFMPNDTSTLKYVSQNYAQPPDADVLIQLYLFLIIVSGVSSIIGWFYFALLESSVKQGTLGKMIVGIKVTDNEGKRISFARATGRYFAKYISAIFFSFGFIMAAFTAKKQALHDLIADTLVLDSSSRLFWNRNM